MVGNTQHTVTSWVLMRITNWKINFLSKGHSTGPKIPFISNLKKPTCASQRDVLELAILRYVYFRDFPNQLLSLCDRGRHERGRKQGLESIQWRCCLLRKVWEDVFRYWKHLLFSQSKVSPHGPTPLVAIYLWKRVQRGFSGGPICQLDMQSANNLTKKTRMLSFGEFY